jgi:hypothetical protein
MCERIGAGQWCVKVFLVQPDQSLKELGESYHWDKDAALRTYRKQNGKSGTRVIMYDTTGKRVRG